MMKVTTISHKFPCHPCKRECTVCHKPYPNLKFYEKHSKRCNSCQSHYVVAKTEKASMENNRRKFDDTTGKQKQYDSDEESASSGVEKKEEEEEYEVEDDSTDRGLIIKEDAQMRPPVKLRTFKRLLLHLQKDNGQSWRPCK